jgi:hypothetical protein
MFLKMLNFTLKRACFQMLNCVLKKKIIFSNCKFLNHTFRNHYKFITDPMSTPESQ